MQALGSRFRPDWPVTRADLAATLVRGGRAPQYLAAQPLFGDVRDRATRVWVESARGLFPDAAGASFAPRGAATRLVAAVALVRAAGLESEAVARQNDTLVGVLDRVAIPAGYGGYVAVALQRGLLTLQGGMFRPAATLTRAELAHACVGLSSV
jgi:hypothetical protein